MINWIIIGVLILIAFALLKIEHHGRRIKVVAIIIIAALLYFSLAGLFNSGEVDINSPKGIMNAVWVYFGWLGKTATAVWEVGTDSVRTVGNAIRFNETEKDDGRR